MRRGYMFKAWTLCLPSNFSTWFSNFNQVWQRGKHLLRLKVPTSSMKTDIQIVGIGNTTVGKAVGLALLSWDQSTPCRHQFAGNQILLGLQLMKILDSKIKPVHGWVVGHLHCAFPAMGAWTARSGSHFPFPEVHYIVQHQKTWKYLLLQKGSEYTSVGRIWRSPRVTLRRAPLPLPICMWPDLHCCPT